MKIITKYRNILIKGEVSYRNFKFRGEHMETLVDEKLLNIFKSLKIIREIRNDITVRQAQIFLGVCIKNGILRMDLRKSVNIGEAVMTRSLDQLFNKGVLLLKKDYRDPRQLRVYLTDEGEEIRNRLSDL